MVASKVLVRLAGEADDEVRGAHGDVGARRRSLRIFDLYSSTVWLRFIGQDAVRAALHRQMHVKLTSCGMSA
jgi:hypothetical protein